MEVSNQLSIIIRVTIGVLMAFVLTAAASVIGWLVLQVGDLRGEHEETDRTQEVVLQRLSTIESMMNQVDDSDRWYKSNELLYQESTEERLKRLEQFHEPYRWKYENNNYSSSLDCIVC